jgi:SecD/SecF fusion protein
VKESNDVLAALNTSFGPLKNEQINSVSASFGSQILRDAIYAVIFSLILITGYVTARFEFKFALPAIIALLHDVLITVGVYSLTGREVTSATVAAVLTVLGYSLYDTIIVFDRVRENTPLLRKNSYAQIVNVSLWETLTRSINTTLITVVPLLALLLFGGATLKDFAFALLIGILSGAYSSLFVASPLLSLWKETEPEYKRRSKAAEPIHKATLGEDVPAKDATVEKERVPALSGAREATVDAADSDDAVASTDDAQAPPSTSGTLPAQDDASAREAARQRRQERRRNRPHGRPR